MQINLEMSYPNSLLAYVPLPHRPLTLYLSALSRPARRVDVQRKETIKLDQTAIEKGLHLTTDCGLYEDPFLWMHHSMAVCPASI